ncbi:MAG: hypothetical protein AAF196_18995 [Planctomycetota bacterium]
MNDRRPQSLFALFFLGMLALSPIADFVVGPVQTVATPPEPSLTELGVWDGRYAGKFVKYVVESSPATVGIRAVRNEVDHLLGTLETDRVDFGVGGTLFAPSANIRAFDRAPAVLRRVKEEADRLGVRILVAPGPDKWRLYPEWFANAAPRSEARHSFYQDLERVLVYAGFEVVDVEELFAARRAAAPGQPLFTPRDTHWDLSARSLLASHVVQRIGELGWWPEGATTSLQLSPPNMSSEPADLVKVLGVTGEMPLARAMEQTFGTVGVFRPSWEVLQPKAEECPWVLCGDSFSVGLQGLLAAAAQRPLDTSASLGGSLTLDQLAKTFDRIESGEIHARILVWVFVERLVVQGWETSSVPDRFRPRGE